MKSSKSKKVNINSDTIDTENRKKSNVNSDSVENPGKNKNSISDPYVNIELIDNIELAPNQMNNNLYENLKSNLKKKVEGKCNKHGYVVSVQKIMDYTNGFVEPENFTGYATYKLKYQAILCIPIENTTIIASIEKKYDNADFIVAVSGPIYIIIRKKISEINPLKFSIQNDGNIYIKDNMQKIEITHKFKIMIKNKKFYTGDEQIKAMGYLEDIATDYEIEKYYKNYNKKEENYNKKEENIEYNDDDEVNEININNENLNEMEI
jgi:DNA-directed RNA polymerase subunit E'/Rpb7